MSFLNRARLYSALPLSIRQAAVSVLGYRNRRIRYGKHFLDQRQLLEQSQYWSPDQMLEYQARKLSSLLHEARSFPIAYNHLPVLSLDEIREMLANHDFSPLPILTKADLRSRTEHYRNRSRDAAAVGSTSGTTGSPMRNERDRESVGRTFAFLAQQRNWLGITEASPSVRLSGRQIVPISKNFPPYWLYNSAENQLFLSTYHLTKTTAGPIADKLHRFRPELIDGYPSAILELGRILGPRARIPSLKAIITTAETLHDSDRELRTKMFDVPVLDYYAASEGVPLIQQCEKGSYHIRPESGIFEILDENNMEVAPGETGELVVTSFCNFRTILIRYKTGDLTIKSDRQQQCACGRTLPTIKKVLGRQEEVAVSLDGRRIGMFAYRVLMPLSGFSKAQIVQVAPDRFSVAVIPDGSRPLPRLKADISSSIENTLGHRAFIDVTAVTDIPRGPNGKHRAFLRTFH